MHSGIRAVSPARQHGNKWCGCVDAAALFFCTLCVLLPRAPLLIQAHLPKEGELNSFSSTGVYGGSVCVWWGPEGGVVNRDRLWQC